MSTTQKHSKTTVLDNVRIFDSKRKGIVENGVIVVERNRIKDLGVRGYVEIPYGDNVEIIDCKGMVALPGLIDAHLHITGFRSGDTVKEPLITPLGVFFARGVKDLEALINSGFTTVVDAGGVIALHLKMAVDEGTVVGPRIVAAGYPLSQTFGHGDVHYLPIEYVDVRTTKLLKPLTSLICDGVDECRKAARYTLREGADFIKVMATGGVLSERDRPEHRQFTLEELKAIVDEARAVGKFVHAHAQGKEGIINAIKAGVKVIAHAIYIDEEVSELAIDNDVVIVPTLSIVHKLMEIGREVGIPEWGLRKSEEVYDAHIANVRKAKKLGVKIATGTDFIGGPFRHGENALELKLFVEKLGMDPTEALISATKVAAEATGLKDVGELSPGKTADIILINGNPLMDINVMLNPNNIALVMKNGGIVKHLIKS
ncbi:MAG: amidohydrolase [Zestosphaera tikiterensis]|uniref:Amidohydrolase n=1 Tax=Zestosphaera tikiterensis TaxID=1973259 RepID=A0A2R7Y7J6_9CREN|nr:MAG: amidohydrolase [Zestosphaera tikiterensis]